MIIQEQSGGLSDIVRLRFGRRGANTMSESVPCFRLK